VVAELKGDLAAAMGREADLQARVSADAQAMAVETSARQAAERAVQQVCLCLQWACAQPALPCRLQTTRARLHAAANALFCRGRWCCCHTTNSVQRCIKQQSLQGNHLPSDMADWPSAEW
jgi:hypothetical protein